MRRTILLLVVLLLAGTIAAPPAGAGKGSQPFDEAHIFFELNHTDGDLGIHGLVDGDDWEQLTIEDPSERKLLDVRVSSRLRQQGLTEVFFESAEPTFDELSPSRFFRRFREGHYRIGGLTLEGDKLKSKVRVTHRMPAPPVPAVNGQPMAIECDEDEPGYDAPELTSPVTLQWDEVTTTHPDLGSPRSSPDIVIHNYQVVVEVEVEDDEGDSQTLVFSVDLPPGVTSMTVPQEFLALGDTFKYEVLVREAGFNQTAVESCFTLAGAR
jgi:hypothetical protein